MTIIESKELIVTKIIDLVKNNPKISQKDVVSLVLNSIESDNEEDKTLVLQTLNNLVQNKVLKRINVGRKVTYSFNDFTEELEETPEEVKEEVINTKKVKQDVNKFILKSLIDGSINKVHLIENTLNELGITENDKIDTSTESKFTLYKGIIGTVLAELNKSDKIAISGSKNKQVVSLVAKEKEVKKTSAKKETKKQTKVSKKEVNEKKVNEDFIESVIDEYDNQISDTLDKMKKEQEDVQRKYNEIQKSNILEFICHSRRAHYSSVPELVAAHIIAKLYGVTLDNAILQGGANDNGIDAVVVVKDPLGFPSKKVAVQMKCYENIDKGCTPNEISKLYGDMARLGFRKGFMVTTGVFDEKAIQKQFTDERGTYVHVAKYRELNFDFGSHERMIICIDGKTLVNYMIEYGLGVLVSDEGNIVGIDREYFDALGED